MNVDNKIGAIGFVSRIISGIYPVAIIKVDPETGEPVRNKRGLCEARQKTLGLRGNMFMLLRLRLS